jgi:hypothetical protein
MRFSLTLSALALATALAAPASAEPSLVQQATSTAASALVERSAGFLM